MPLSHFHDNLDVPRLRTECVNVLSFVLSTIIDVLCGSRSALLTHERVIPLVLTRLPTEDELSHAGFI